MGRDNAIWRAIRIVIVAVVTVATTVASGMFAWILITATPESAPVTAEDQAVAGLERSVQQNLATWESQSVSVVTGELLGDVDFTADVVVINNTTAAVPSPWRFGPYGSITIPTPAGDMAVDWAESTQPFRVRELLNTSGVPVADILIFAGASYDGGNYLRHAIDRWNPSLGTTDQILRGAVILTALTPANDALSGGTWFASLTPNVVVLIEASPGFTQHDLTTFLIGWRASLVGS